MLCVYRKGVILPFNEIGVARDMVANLLTSVPAHTRRDNAQEEGLIRVVWREGALHQDVVLAM